MTIDNQITPVVNQPPKRFTLSPWVYDILLVFVLLIGAYFRFVGVNWDDGHHLHPDERFLTMVETAISPVKDLSEYFDTDNSSLNPHNRGYSFYVYGTLPIFITRYVAEWIQLAGYDQVNVVGRILSGLTDLLTVLMVYLIGTRLYDRRVGLIAAAFSAFAVLQIQLSHFFTVDTFTNFFTFLAFYFAVIVMTNRPPEKGPEPDEASDETGEVRPGKSDKRLLIMCLLFGVALGMAMASKVSAAPLAILLPGAMAVWFFRLPVVEQRRQIPLLLRNLVLAAVAGFLVFRIFQPYAFEGPGFFGVIPNQKWIANLQELQAQSTGDVDFPPALQWARRPIWFAGQNMILWGLGVPLGVLAWLGFFWMGWRIFRKKEWQHSLLWFWTGIYFAWQSISWVRSMRYQLLVYPTLALIAAWAVVWLWDKFKTPAGERPRFSLGRLSAIVIGSVALAGTFIWAYAFSNIYTRPVTRVQASHWIYQNVNGTINLRLLTPQGPVNQPLPYRAGEKFVPGTPFRTAFTVSKNSLIQEVKFEHLIDTQGAPDVKTLRLKLFDAALPDQALSVSDVQDVFPATSDPRGQVFSFFLPAPLTLLPDRTYLLELENLAAAGEMGVYGAISLSSQTSTEQTFEAILPYPVNTVRREMPYSAAFTSSVTGSLSGLYLPHVVDREALPGKKSLQIIISTQPSGDVPLATFTLTGDFLPFKDLRGQPYEVTFDKPALVQKGVNYYLVLRLVDGDAALSFYGDDPAHESSWDDALPIGVDSYAPYDIFGGIYRGDLNFEMYWDDNEDKRSRFLSILDQADFLFISSNRQWGTTVRVPERYPLTSAYYRNLLGCPAESEITWCYSVAEPGMFKGNLGFDLVATFQSDPNVDSWRFNDQFAEEAFTVYDHPKVLIFKKTADYDFTAVQKLFGQVDLTQVIHVTPRQAGSQTTNLMLPVDRLAVQQAGGTWMELFNLDALQNRYPIVGLVLWYLSVTVLGLLAYPLLRLALPGLPDHGYPLARIGGLLVLAYITWLAGSLQIPVTRLTISIVLLLLALGAGVLAYRQRDGLLEEWRSKRRYFIVIEIIALLFFVLDVLIRVGNPDLWHPAKGGEKPMDLSYFTAVLKSTTFPPYDPWYEGGYLNYYYYGYVIVGVLVKWLGITPSIAYNLILPSLFSMAALGAFSVAWNLTAATQQNSVDPSFEDKPRRWFEQIFTLGKPLWIGLAAAVALVILGNLGTVNMIWVGFQRLAAPGGAVGDAGIFTRLWWGIQGFGKTLSGTPLPYGYGDWYWNPSRVIPAPGDVEPITEFPFFTFLYADLHAHMMALPITLLTLSWSLSMLLGRWRWGDTEGGNVRLSLVLDFLLGGIAIGALRPTHTWDVPTQLALGAIVTLYAAIRYAKPAFSWLMRFSEGARRLIVGLAGVAVLILLTFELYLPYSQWYLLGYNAVGIWKGTHTPIKSYWIQWGVFLFIFISWLFWETIEWMATTPLSAVHKLKPYKWLIQVSAIGTVIVIIALLILGVSIAWFVIPLALWVTVLILKPGLGDVKRGVLFLIGTGLLLTLLAEVIVLEGDIGRMNWVFRLYYQTWTLFVVSSAAMLGWLLTALPRWRPGWSNAWRIILALLVAGTALFPITATMDKIRDRMAPNAPHTLDGMEYMNYAHYNDFNKDMDLSQDYRAIRWMQRNVTGSPVIVEANIYEYHWGSRFTIYTGLPGVVGWNWHQRQQRAVINSSWVEARVQEVGEFYKTTKTEAALDFLQKYDVKYIIVGQQERAFYPGEGLNKFEELDGKFWKAVYRDGETVIYQILG